MIVKKPAIAGIYATAAFSASMLLHRSDDRSMVCDRSLTRMTFNRTTLVRRKRPARGAATGSGVARDEDDASTHALATHVRANTNGR
jgi:hypothetical protein